MGHLDFLTATLPYTTEYLSSLPELPAFEIVDNHHKLPRYEIAFELKCGGVLAIPSEENKRQKIMVNLTGENLLRMRKLRTYDEYALDQLIRKGAKFTRIDVAFDSDDSFSAPIQTYNSWFMGNRKTILRSDPRLIESPEGDTVYFGSTKSDRMVRVYDKAKEMKLLGQILTRVELQARKPYAGVVARDAINGTVSQAGAAHIRKVIDFPQLEWWSKLLDTGGLQPGTIGRNDDTDILRWLERYVKPAIMKLKKTGTIRERRALIQWHDSIWPEYVEKSEE